MLNIHSTASILTQVDDFGASYIPPLTQSVNIIVLRGQPVAEQNFKEILTPNEHAQSFWGETSQGQCFKSLSMWF